MILMKENNQIDKIDQAINSIIDQIHYLTGSTIIPDIQMIASKKSYDPFKDKIRGNSDLVWQLSTSLSSLIMIRNQLNRSNDKGLDDAYEFIFTGKSKKGDK